MGRYFLLLFFAFACARQKPPVILISVDTLRADHLPVYGYSGVKTPAIDALRRDGVLFTTAWSHCPMTLPSHVSMLTGLLPTEHGVRNNIGFTFRPDQHATIAQALKRHGYATGASVSAFVLRGRTGLRAAFDWYDDVDDPSRSATALDLERPGAITVANATRWIDAQDGKPFFLFVHLFEPHAPYANGYDGEIATADAAIAHLIGTLKQKGIYDRALIIFTSDHGEGLGDHGEQQHSVLLYSEQLHVPMIVKMPRGERAGTTIPDSVQLADIAPTIAAVTGVGFKGGRTATPMFAAGRRSIYSETLFPRIHLGWSDLASLLDGSHHYIGGPKPELYDVEADPREIHNIISDDRRDATRLRSALDALRVAAPSLEPIEPETAASLAALGYVGSTASRSSEINPRDHILEYESMRDDMADAIAIDTALRKRDLATATKHAERVKSRPNASAAALLMAAKAEAAPQAKLQLLDRAEAKARAAGKWPMPQLALIRGNAFVAAGRYDDALRSYNDEVRAFPNDLGAFATMASLYFAMNDGARGHATLEAMFEKNKTREAATLAARTCAAVEDMQGAARWGRVAERLPN